MNGGRYHGLGLWANIKRSQKNNVVKSSVNVLFYVLISPSTELLWEAAEICELDPSQVATSNSINGSSHAYLICTKEEVSHVGNLSSEHLLTESEVILCCHRRRHNGEDHEGQHSGGGHLHQSITDCDCRKRGLLKSERRPTDRPTNRASDAEDRG